MAGIHGRTLEDELGTGWTQEVHAEDLKHCLETYNQFLIADETFRMEYRLRRHDGEYRWLLDIGVPRFNSDGSFVGYVGCCIDISDQKEARAILTELSGRLLRAGEEERAKIARELHDDINQRLAVLANRIQDSESAATDPLQKKELSETWRLTNEIATDIQHISHQLHPSKLHYLGLAATIRDLCREFSKQHRIGVECVLQDLPQELDENVSLSLFRVVQESLRNVAKHSRSHHATVRLTYRSGMIQLFISDDGVGFDPCTTQRSWPWADQHARTFAFGRRRVLDLVKTISWYASSGWCSCHCETLPEDEGVGARAAATRLILTVVNRTASK